MKQRERVNIFINNFLRSRSLIRLFARKRARRRGRIGRGLLPSFPATFWNGFFQEFQDCGCDYMPAEQPCR